MNNYDIIVKPVLSEKSYSGIGLKDYTFIVLKQATKTEIKAAVEEAFGVEVIRINTRRCMGKKKRQGMFVGTTTAYKKAIVTLSKDSKSIEFFEGL